MKIYFKMSIKESIKKIDDDICSTKEYGKLRETKEGFNDTLRVDKVGKQLKRELS